MSLVSAQHTTAHSRWRFGGAALRNDRSLVALLLTMLFAGVACGEDRGAGAGKSLPSWVTEAEYRFGDPAEGEVFFTRPVVQADPARGRIFAVDRPNHQVSVLTPDGTVLFRVGQEGEGPGEFSNIGSLHIKPDGTFTVREAWLNRYTRFTVQGELVETTVGPGASASYQGLAIDLHWPAEGAYLGTPFVPNALEAGWHGLAPMTRRPLVRVRDLGDGRWSDPEPLLWLDISNRMLDIPVPGDPETIEPIITSQPFADPDYVRFEPGGTAVVLRLKGNPPGTVELIEVDAGGDTTWHRRVELGGPIRLTSAMVEEAVESFVAARGRDTPAWLRQGYYDGIYQPEYVPPATGPPVLTASREVWIRTPELLDSLRVYYAVPRVEPTGLPRRVLVPEWLWVTDATETHVWGIRWGMLDRPIVIGRRLVPQPSL